MYSHFKICCYSPALKHDQKFKTGARQKRTDVLQFFFKNKYASQKDAYRPLVDPIL